MVRDQSDAREGEEEAGLTERPYDRMLRRACRARREPGSKSD